MLVDTVDISTDNVPSGGESARAVRWKGDVPERKCELQMFFEPFHGLVVGIDVPCFGCGGAALKSVSERLRKRTFTYRVPLTEIFGLEGT